MAGLHKRLSRREDCRKRSVCGTSWQSFQLSLTARTGWSGQTLAVSSYPLEDVHDPRVNYSSSLSLGVKATWQALRLYHAINLPLNSSIRCICASRRSKAVPSCPRHASRDLLKGGLAVEKMVLSLSGSRPAPYSTRAKIEAWLWTETVTHGAENR